MDYTTYVYKTLQYYIHYFKQMHLEQVSHGLQGELLFSLC